VRKAIPSAADFAGAAGRGLRSDFLGPLPKPDPAKLAAVSASRGGVGGGDGDADSDSDRAGGSLSTALAAASAVNELVTLRAVAVLPRHPQHLLEPRRLPLHVLRPTDCYNYKILISKR
jgi:hypothetical protein